MIKRKRMFLFYFRFYQGQSQLRYFVSKKIHKFSRIKKSEPIFNRKKKQKEKESYEESY